ncbi:MAG TPA: Ig-like domain-containing protein [Candidatus Methylomirabilis sp.]|nr:Ig-like domain-containing protein [Candidatus Methylomirabilis sp.]
MLTSTITIPATNTGSATLTAGPLNDTSQSASIQVVPPPPTIVSLLPPAGTLYVGATATLTLALNAAQLTDTTVAVTVVPSGIVDVPPTVTIPAGSLTSTVTVTGLAPGSATLTAGPLHGTSAQSTLTVNQLPPTVTGLNPPTLSLPKGKVGELTLTIAPTQPEATVVTLASADPSTVEVPASMTVPAGASTAPIPVLTRSVGLATITAGPLNGTTQSATVTVTPAELVTLAITPPAPTIAKGQTQAFTLTGTYTDGTTQDLTGTATWASSNETIATIASPGGVATGVAAGQVTITATITNTITNTVSATATLTVTPPILARIAVLPETPTKTGGRTLQFTAQGTLTDGSTQDATGAILAWTSSDPAVATITSPGGLATALAEGTTTITATHLEGFTASTTLTVTVLPPDPITVAPPVSPGVTTTLAAATEFLYAGADPVQTGMVPGTIEATRAAVVRGRVLSRDGNPLSGVTISILNHPEYGTTLSRTDGLFDLAVNGGSQLTVQYQKAGYLPAQRPVTPAWQDYAWLPDVALIPYDTRVTTVDLTAATPLQVARGSQVTDADDTRQATLFFSQGTTASIQLPGGGTQPLTTLSVRATEYTVGPNGPKAMPAPLPANTGYTYDAVYQQPAALYRAFGYNGGALITGSKSRMALTLWQEDRTRVGAGWDARGHGLGGWSLDVHHAYDVSGRTLYLGDGGRREPTEVRGIIQTLVGGGTVIAPRDGVEALRVALGPPMGVAVDGRGTLYVSERGSGVFKITPDGRFHTVVPSGQGFSGDGGPALDPQGNLYIADELNDRVRQVDPAGIITTVAGGWEHYGLPGAGGPRDERPRGLPHRRGRGRPGEPLRQRHLWGPPGRV